MTQEAPALQVVFVETRSVVHGHTGEVVEQVPVVLAKRLRWREKYVMLFQEAIWRFSLDPEPGKETWRVLGNLLGRLDWDNWLVVSYVEIGGELGMARQQIYRAMKHLCRKGLVLQGPKAGNRNTYRLNSGLAYKGRIPGLRKRRREEHTALTQGEAR